MKITNKKTVLVFNTMQEKESAIDFLLAMNYKFQGILRKPVIFIAPSLYLKQYLDLYLPNHIAGSTFNYKN